jgi:hypothetical protein
MVDPVMCIWSKGLIEEEHVEVFADRPMGARSGRVSPSAFATPTPTLSMPQLKIRCRDAEISADVDSIEIGHIRILTSGGSLSLSIRAFLPVP